MRVSQRIIAPKLERLRNFGALTQVRHRLSVGGSEKMQLSALLGAFKIAVELSQKS